MKRTNSMTRVLCMVLAVVAMISFVPVLAIETQAADTANSFYVFYDFNSGTVGNALVKEDLTNSAAGATGLSASSNRFYYDKDPKNSSNIVLRSNTTPYSSKVDYCGEFSFKDNGLILANTTFAISAKFYIKEYPTKGKESGEPLSLIAVNNGSAVPVVRLTKDGYLELRNTKTSSTSDKYEILYDVGKIERNKWVEIKTVIDNANDTVYLYVDGVYKAYWKTIDFATISNVRILQNHGKWSILVDDLSVYTLNMNELLDFDNLASGASITASGLSNSLSSFASVTEVGGSLVAKADPENANNIVSYNNGNAYLMKLKQNNIYNRDFVVSGKFRFESFPSVSGGAGSASLFAWVVGDSYKIFCGVDQDGNFLSRSSDKAYAPTGVVLNRNQWYTVSVHYDGDSGKFNVYLDGAYVCSGKWAPPSTIPSSSYIRVLNVYNNNNFKVYVDDIQLYDLENRDDGVLIPKDNVIHNIDFESGFAGTKPTKGEIDSLSPYAGVSVVSTWTDYGTLVKDDSGNTMIKVEGADSGVQLDLVVGNGSYDPLKYGTVRFAYDIIVEEYPSASAQLRLARWRKFHMTAVKDAANILNLSNTGEICIFNTPTGFFFTKGVKYNVEVIFNNRILNNKEYVDFSVNISYEVEENGVKKTVTKTIVDSYNAINISVNGTNSTLLDDENIAYFLDDAGNKCYMPYTGLVKCFKLDADGNKVTDANNNYVYVDKLVVSKTTYSPDMIRICQGSNSASSGFTYYLDNIIVEQIEDKSIIDTTFDGWELFNYTKEGSTVTMPSGNTNNYLFESATNNSRFVRDSATLVNNNGNTYVQLGGTDISSQKHFYVYDPDLNFYGKDIIIETKVYLSAVSSTAYSTPGSMIATVSKKTNSGSYDNFGFLLRADHNGYLYTDADKVNPIGRLKVGDWTKISIILTGNGTTWNNVRILIDDELVSSIQKSFSAMVGSRFRFTNMANTVIGYDDLSIRPYVEEVVPAPLTMDFESTIETSEMISTLGVDWVYGTIGATRTDADGVTVKNTEIRGDEGAKYLRVNHSRVKESELASFIDAKESKFIYNDTYLIETAVRYTANTSYGLTVAEVYNTEKGKSAALLSVKGETNELLVNLRGVSYNVIDSAKNLSYAKGINDDGFTKVAILVDDVNNTYTLYIDGKLAYYLYGDRVLPCLDLPMHFMDTKVEFGEDFIRLFEISSVKYADSILDIDYVNVKSTPNGLAAEVKGSQTRAVSADENKFDVRFVSGLDSLYAGSVGYEVTADYTTGESSYTKNYDIFSHTVFEKIDAAGTYVTAESLDSEYLAAIEILDIPTNVTVTFTVKPYVLRSNVKVYGESYTVTFANGNIAK